MPLRIRFSELTATEKPAVLRLDPLENRDEFHSFQTLLEQFSELNSYTLDDVKEAASSEQANSRNLSRVSSSESMLIDTGLVTSVPMFHSLVFRQNGRVFLSVARARRKPPTTPVCRECPRRGSDLHHGHWNSHVTPSPPVFGRVNRAEHSRQLNARPNGFERFLHEQENGARPRRAGPQRIAWRHIEFFGMGRPCS
jgi:hypothetical protein